MTSPEQELSDAKINWLLDDPAGDALIDQALDEMYPVDADEDEE